MRKSLKGLNRIRSIRSSNLIKLPNKEEIDNKKNQENDSKQLIAVCCCGFAPKSLKYTKESIKKNILDILEKEFIVDVYTYSYISKNNIIESNDTNKHGSFINNDDVNLLESKVRTVYQEDVSDIIKNIISDKNISLRNISVINFLRELLMEKYSYQMIKESKKKYKSIIYVHPDMFISKPISIKEVYDTINVSNSLYTTTFNDWNGYGTGFYIGNPFVIERITNRIDELRNISKIESEKLLKTCVTNAKIHRYKSCMFYFKIKVDGKPDMFFQLLKKYTSTKEYMIAISLYKQCIRITENKEATDTNDTVDTNDIIISPKKSRRQHKMRSSTK